MGERAIPLGVNTKTLVPFNSILAISNKMDRMIMKRILLHKNFNVIADVKDGFILLSILEKMSPKPDLLVIEQDLDSIKGLDVIKQIRPSAPEMKIAIITGHSEKELVNELLQQKVNALIVKPFNEQKIADKLATAFNRKDLLPREVIVYKKLDINYNELKLPAIPNVIAKVLTFNIEDPTLGSAELEKIISPDKAISTNIIRVSNSAFYGRSGKIKSLKDAITLIGIKNIKSLVFIEAKKMLHKGLKHPLFTKYLQEFPILTSLISFDLANPLGMKKIGEQLFLSSLFRKIGMSIFALNFTDIYIGVLKVFDFGLINLYELEREKFNTDSIIMGHKIFKIWSMPDNFLDVISNQNFNLDKIDSVSDVDKITRLAEIYTLKLIGIGASPDDENLKGEILKKYGKTAEEMDEIFGEDYYDMIKDHPFYSIAMGRD